MGSTMGNKKRKMSGLILAGTTLAGAVGTAASVNASSFLNSLTSTAGSVVGSIATHPIIVVAVITMFELYALVRGYYKGKLKALFGGKFKEVSKFVGNKCEKAQSSGKGLEGQVMPSTNETKDRTEEKPELESKKVKNLDKFVGKLSLSDFKDVKYFKESFCSNDKIIEFFTTLLGEANDSGGSLRNFVAFLIGCVHCEQSYKGMFNLWFKDLDKNGLKVLENIIIKNDGVLSVERTKNFVNLVYRYLSKEECDERNLKSFAKNFNNIGKSEKITKAFVDAIRAYSRAFDGWCEWCNAEPEQVIWHLVRLCSQLAGSSEETQDFFVEYMKNCESCTTDKDYKCLLSLDCLSLVKFDYTEFIKRMFSKELKPGDDETKKVVRDLMVECSEKRTKEVLDGVSFRKFNE